IVHAELLGALAHPDVAKSRLRHLVAVGGSATAKPDGLFAMHAWDSWLASQSADLEAANTHRDEMAFWMYSSGSTGRPKGVVHLQHDAAYTYESYGRRVLGIREDDIAFSPPNIFFGLPTLYNALVAHPGSERRDLSSVRLCVSAAEVLSGELFNEWRRRYGHAIVEGLGSTEVLHIYLSNRVDRQKLGASGARVPGYEIKL